MIKVLIVDDHEIIRRGIRMILKGEDNISVVGEASDGEEALEIIKFLDFDILLLDLDMPKKHGISLIKEIKAMNPNIKILILTIYPEDENAIQILQAGADGFSNKGTALEQLVLAIKTIYQKGKFISDTLSDEIASSINNSSLKPHKSLSPRDFRIFMLTASGKSPKEIADELNTSLSTVSRHKTEVYKKLKIKNDAELIRYCIENSVISFQYESPDII